MCVTAAVFCNTTRCVTTCGTTAVFCVTLLCCVLWRDVFCNMMRCVVQLLCFVLHCCVVCCDAMCVTAAVFCVTMRCVYDVCYSFCVATQCVTMCGTTAVFVLQRNALRCVVKLLYCHDVFVWWCVFQLLCCHSAFASQLDVLQLLYCHNVCCMYHSVMCHDVRCNGAVLSLDVLCRIPQSVNTHQECFNQLRNSPKLYVPCKISCSLLV